MLVHICAFQKTSCSSPVTKFKDKLFIRTKQKTQPPAPNQTNLQNQHLNLADLQYIYVKGVWGVNDLAGG